MAAAAISGSNHVLCTDYDATCVELSRRNAERNGLGSVISGAVYDWTKPEGDPLMEGVSLVLACDVLYSTAMALSLERAAVRNHAVFLRVHKKPRHFLRVHKKPRHFLRVHTIAALLEAHNIGRPKP
jgi:predicted nicotinamide N-methyase